MERREKGRGEIKAVLPRRHCLHYQLITGTHGPQDPACEIGLLLLLLLWGSFELRFPIFSPILQLPSINCNHSKSSYNFVLFFMLCHLKSCPFLRMDATVAVVRLCSLPVETTNQFSPSLLHVQPSKSTLAPSRAAPFHTENTGYPNEERTHLSGLPAHTWLRSLTLRLSPAALPL